MDIYLRKELNRLVPDSESDEELLRKIAVGEVVRVKLQRPRNILFHRKFFALLDVAFQNQEKYTNREAFRAEVTILAGHFEVRYRVNGDTVLDPKSISFAKMDEDAFAVFYQAAIDAILENFLPGTDPESLQEEVDRIIQFA